MSSELVVLEQQLQIYERPFARVLGAVMAPARLMQTVVNACDRNRELLACDRETLFSAAMTFATLGLEVDGVTGQGYLVPFKETRNNRTVVQPIIGYKGYNTLGARSGLTISGGVVREDDEFDYREGTAAFVHHRRKLGGETERRILAAWATATANDRPATVKVLSIDEIIAIKAKSPRGSKPPWSDPSIGFPAMAEKSTKRRLARDMPLNVFQAAARMEEVFEEQAKPAWIHPDKGVIDGNGIIAPNYNDQTPTTAELISPPTLEERAREAADRGTEAVRAFCRGLRQSEFARIRAYVESLEGVAKAADLAKEEDSE
jgi:recombination protein RecT